MASRILKIKAEWDERVRRLGKSKRSVLFKRFPFWLNNHIHRRHRDFILKNMPEPVSDILDIGCGYGRISREIIKKHTAVSISGIELCEDFSIAYRKEFGSCFTGSIQEFQTEKHYDVIVIVTVLMYLNREELAPTVEKYWSMLAPGGVIICIEPAIEFIQLWRRLTGKALASPTGGDVIYFEKHELKDLFTKLEHAVIKDEMSVNLLPGMTFSSLHHGFAVTRNFES